MEDDTNQFPVANPEASQSSPTKKKQNLSCLLAVVGSIILLILIGAYALYYFLVHKPNKTLDINPKFRVDSVSVSKFKLSTSKVTASWDLGFSVHNPSNDSFLYQRVEVSMLYKQQLLTTETIPPFIVRQGNWRPVQVKLKAKSVHVDHNTKTMEANAAERANRLVKFDVHFYVGYWIGADSSNKVWSVVEALCNDVKVAFSSKDDHVGKFFGGPTECKITKTW